MLWENAFEEGYAWGHHTGAHASWATWDFFVEDCLITQQRKKTKPHSESYHLKVDKELLKVLWPFFITSHLALLTVAIASSEYYFDLYSQRRICLRIKTYVIGQLSWSLVNNSVYLASWIITALGSRLEFHQCNQKLAFPTCVLRLYRQGHWSE